MSIFTGIVIFFAGAFLGFIVAAMMAASGRAEDRDNSWRVG